MVKTVKTQPFNAVTDAPPGRTMLNAALMDALAKPQETPAIAVINDPAAIRLVTEYLAAKAAATALEAKDEYGHTMRQRIEKLMGDAPKAIIGNYVAMLSPIKGSPGKIVTEDMVGTVIGIRAPGFRLDIS